MSEIDAKGASRAEIDAQRGLKSRAEMSALLSKSPKVGRIRGQGGRKFSSSFAAHVVSWVGRAADHLSCLVALVDLELRWAA